MFHAFWSKRYGGIDEGIFPFKAGGEKLIFVPLLGKHRKGKGEDGMLGDDVKPASGLKRDVLLIIIFREKVRTSFVGFNFGV